MLSGLPALDFRDSWAPTPQEPDKRVLSMLKKGNQKSLWRQFVYTGVIAGG